MIILCLWKGQGHLFIFKYSINSACIRLSESFHNNSNPDPKTLATEGKTIKYFQLCSKYFDILKLFNNFLLLR